MSSPEFADYTRIAKLYDLTRIPVGVGLLKRLVNENQVLLDAGCGTGNYIAHLAPSVKKVVGLESNPGMLQQARAKFKNSEKVELVQGSLLETLPFADNQFDGVLLNQVLHHLDNDLDNFPNAQNLFKELYRVLKPGGFLAINTVTSSQKNALWWVNLMPRVRDEYMRRYIPLEKLGGFLTTTGYVRTQAVGIKEPLQGLNYYNLMGPLANFWRAGDSRWQLVTDKELAEIQQAVLDKIAKNEMGKFFDEHDATRIKDGLTTEIVTFKPDPVARKQAEEAAKKLAEENAKKTTEETTPEVETTEEERPRGKGTTVTEKPTLLERANKTVSEARRERHNQTK